MESRLLFTKFGTWLHQNIANLHIHLYLLSNLSKSKQDFLKSFDVNLWFLKFIKTLRHLFVYICLSYLLFQRNNY